MGRVSTKENKNIYQQCREELKLSREKASELLKGITPERIEKIENERSDPHPEEVLLMADGYMAPQLCNHYCANQCPIGKQYTPEIEIKALSQIVLEMVASMNSVRKSQERLIEITVDGEIGDDEIPDFVRIQEELERISVTIETLHFRTVQMIANGKIDNEKYEQYKRNH